MAAATNESQGDEAMTQTSFEEFAALPAAEVPTPTADHDRLTRWQSLLVAVGSLVLIYGVALGVMAAGGAIAHSVDPGRRLDIFAALHSVWVIGVLLVIPVLWLLPPHPWATRAAAGGRREQPPRTGDDP